MKILKNISRAEIFIAMVALAALIHSTWSVSVMFNGIEPGIADLASGLHWLWWVLPGFLFAIALDIGQLSSAHTIRGGSKSKLALTAKVFTFATMATFSYALQLLYLLHHVPSLSFGTGLSIASQKAAQTVWEVCIWLIPGMLPVSIIMFTATDTIGLNHHNPQTAEPPGALALLPSDQPELITIETPLTSAANQSETDATNLDDKMVSLAFKIAEILQQKQSEPLVSNIEIECDYPGCSFGVSRPTRQGAINALNAHRRIHKAAL